MLPQYSSPIRRIGNTILIKLLPAPLLLFSFILKLTFVTLFYSIYLLHKLIVFNLSVTLLLVLSPKLLNFITLLVFLNLSTGIRQNERIKYKVLSHIQISQNWPTFLPPHFCFVPFTSLYSVFLSYYP